MSETEKSLGLGILLIRNCVKKCGGEINNTADSNRKSMKCISKFMGKCWFLLRDWIKNKFKKEESIKFREKIGTF